MYCKINFEGVDKFMLKVLNGIKLSIEDRERLTEIITMMEEENKEFYDCLSFNEEELINKRGLEHALYLLSEDDNIKDTEYYEYAGMPYYNDCKYNDLAYMLDDLRVDLDVRTGYWRYHPNNAIIIQDIYSDGDWELEGADILHTLFCFDEYSDAENIAKELKLDYYYYHNQIQLNYLVSFDDILKKYQDDEDFAKDINDIIKLIGKMDEWEYDEKGFEEFKEKIMELKQAM